jgi:hypothetical protein
LSGVVAARSSVFSFAAARFPDVDGRILAERNVFFALAMAADVRILNDEAVRFLSIRV